MPPEKVYPKFEETQILVSKLGLVEVKRMKAPFETYMSLRVQKAGRWTSKLQKSLEMIKMMESSQMSEDDAQRQTQGMTDTTTRC